ncbi:basic amino acid ABC transporter substrate-binding protein [Solicola gregarius]|uniref:Basic amino acid ABC transporter substrate-binding protein n=1 Tax=Solicola gregarius TaxID=2908642 RepID=A0AA46TLP5_9ACTN|nr:basic amino acid ABC transporter substrate-binding protein [Solicola gregarius]UYM07234.1 basic amino acid ABC transporter substrate-binding protein [Solicola gregarius]
MRLKTLAAILAASTLALSACGSDDDDGGGGSGSGSDISTISEGTLTVCSDIPYEPFEYEDGGGYTGFDMDLMAAIAKGLDLELEVKDVGFDGLQSGASLAAGQCDIGASAMTITEEREANIDFSEPYYDSKQTLLVPSDSDIQSIDDLSGTKVGVQQGTTGKLYAEENAPDDAELVSFPSDAELYQAIKSGSIDAILQDLPVNLTHTEDGDFQIVEEYDTDESYGFAVKEEGAEALLEGVNEQLAKLKKDGSYDKIYNKYFSTAN